MPFFRVTSRQIRDIGTLPEEAEEPEDVGTRTGPAGRHWRQTSASNENGRNQLRKRTRGFYHNKWQA
jgi:hypothetical protein